MTALRRQLGRFLLGAGLLLYLFTVFCFAVKPQHFAAYTVLPIWLWGGCGLLLCGGACFMMRGGWPWLMAAVWAITLVIGADEARVLTHGGKSAPLPGPAAPHDGNPVVRVITCNCALFVFGDPSRDLAAWQPDIVLLQDIYPHQVRLLATALFGEHGDFRARGTNGIVTRWKIQREVPNNSNRDQQATVTLPDGSAVEVVNVHLTTAATDLRFWQRVTWRDHRINRARRLHELMLVQQALAGSTDFPNTPVLFGGDFNAPATDAVHQQLRRGLSDAFAAAGTGWGDTYHRRFPILRIDYLYASRHFLPVRCHTITTRHSDHRMVVADFVMRK
jgi:endonuclease/exonuclease/phosphatase (EEP) superfamily protein YafD